MRWSKIHRIELNRSLYCACGLLNVGLLKSIADFVVYHKIGCAFFCGILPSDAAERLRRQLGGEEK